MNPITHDELVELSRITETPCVSIYAPMNVGGFDVQADAALLRTLLQEAFRRLVDRGEASERARSLLAPATGLVDDIESWGRQVKGVALYMASEFFRTYELAVPTPAHVAASDRFHLLPAFSSTSGDGRYLFLALSKNGARLFEGTRARFTQCFLGSEGNWFLDRAEANGEQRELQLHGGGRPSGKMEAGHQGAIFHGGGSEVDWEKQELAKHFRVLDKHVAEMMGSSRTPLVLGGVEYLQSIYRQVSKHGDVTVGTITGSLDHSTTQSLHEASWAIVEPTFERSRREALEALRNLMGTGLASSTPEEIATAASDGRVSVLFFEEGVEEAMQAAINRVAVEAIAHRGTVYPVAAGEIGDPGRMAAVFRY